MRQVYLDYAAATPLDPRVLEVMKPYFSDLFYNPSASYAPALSVRKQLEVARQQIAQEMGAQAVEIVFTAGGTEALNLAIHGVMSQDPTGNLLLSAIEHEAVREPAAAYNHQEVPVDSSGRIDLIALKNLITDQTALVALMQANNEIGTIQPVKEVGLLIKEVRAERRRSGNSRPLYLLVDACQAAGYLDINVARLGADLLVINGGKLYGMKQSGALFVRKGILLKPLLSGGGQERNLRSGTENVAAAIGLAEALRLAQNESRQHIKREKELSDRLIDGLLKIKGVTINGSRRFRMPNNVHATFEGKDNERLLLQLEEQGIYASAGSACSAASDEPSHVLSAIGLDEASARASVRFSLGRQTTEEDIDYVLSVIRSLC